MNDDDQIMELACEHISSKRIGAPAFDDGKIPFERHTEYSQVKLAVAEDDNGINIFAPGRPATPRREHRTHRVNLDVFYDALRRPLRCWPCMQNRGYEIATNCT